MERRVLLAITLSFLVLFLFQRFVMPPPPEAPANATAATSPPAATASPSATTASPSTQPAAPSLAAASPASLPAAEATITEPGAREVVVETAKVKAVFSNRGGVLTHWVLKDFRNDNGQPLDLVPQGAGASAIKPFSLTVDDAKISARLNESIYRVTVNGAPAGTSIDATSTAQTIEFETASADGLNVRKRITLEPTSYVIAMTQQIHVGSQQLNPTIHWGPGLGDEIARSKPSSFLSPSYNTPAAPLVHKDGKVTRLRASDTGTQEGSLRYAGVDDHYFVSMLVNESGAQVRMDYAPVLAPQQDDPAIVGHYVAYALRFAQPQEQSKFFLGPKGFEDLRAISPEATRVINYGMFSWLAVPLLGALKWVHGYVGNWGWSIIALTLLINFALFPLRHKSVVSMRKMQEIQPQMKAIQDRYAKYKVTDPERQKMNTEIMELYKAKGVNPASGCVPMLLTFPFLFAFYSMLSQSIEIRGADFMGWIHNLSAPDPLFIFPVLNGAAQFLQMKLQPAGGDPAQQKVMMVMPIMFLVMSFNFPSGLVIYWLVATLFTIGQQYFTNYLIGAPARAKAK